VPIRRRATRTVAFLSAVLVLAGCQRETEAPGPTKPAAAAAAPTYVGGAACAGCHADAAAAWTGSHHDLAMQIADERTMLGDFGGATFTKDGVTTTFFRRDGGWWVNTDGPDGRLADFRIRYTFGVEPLQQYLIEFPDGRVQALDIAWDARPKPEGGQRWYHLHPDEKVPAGDALHWTGPALNWNHSCAECHSTNLAKGYDAKTDTFKTTWSDIDVSCEACHGPGSRHVAWADASADARAKDPRHGLVFALHGGDPGAWSLPLDGAIARRRDGLPDRSEVETCGRCHSRRAQVWPEYRFGDALAQTHRVSLLDEGLYHADGQIQGEVYEYGSFLQSAMYAAGVTCTDCHEPHRGRLRAEGNAVCTQCHRAATYDVASHHHHRDGGAGSRCVECHMIERTYMGIDTRRDHGFRVPRPDVSAAVGTPNACNDCHADRDAAWAARRVETWFGPVRAGRESIARALHAARIAAPDAALLVRALATDLGRPAIVRATALEAMSSGVDGALVGSFASDGDPLVRRAAAATLTALPPDAALGLGARLVADGTRTVRLEAVDPLLRLPFERLDPAARGALDRAVAEYTQAQEANADRVEGPLNLGTLALHLGNAALAEREFRAAVARQPQFVPAHVNLAEALRELGREADAESELRRAVGLAPDHPAAHHALGLSLVRQRRLPEAIAALDRAAQLRPQDPRYAYVLAIALHDTGEPARAVRVLAESVQRHPGDVPTLVALAQWARESGDAAAVRIWSERLEQAARGYRATTRVP
jgi:predicted CXXCH cytochrome family protein